MTGGKTEKENKVEMRTRSGWLAEAAAWEANRIGDPEGKRAKIARIMADACAPEGEEFSRVPRRALEREEAYTAWAEDTLKRHGLDLY